MLSVYNTLSRTKEEFKPLEAGKVGIYVCGPTVYGHSHMGHAKSYVSFDVIIRWLKASGYNVFYVQNITDVGHLTDDADMGEDKIAKQSRSDRVHPMALVETYTRSYFDDMDALNLLRPDISPRATGHITEQIAIVERLIKRGFAYTVNGSVYYDVGKDPQYGKLSNRRSDEAETGTRVEAKSEKRNPNDFALWKKADPTHIMQWPSPWGQGFPGWHVECSAMSMKYLGETFDIHGGGMDNVFPHHECEIAQSEKATAKPFARYWLHNNLVTVGGQKMGKSLGNVVSLKDAIPKHGAMTVRFFILQSHYRGMLDFSDQAVTAAGKGLEKITNTIRNIEEAAGASGGGPSAMPANTGMWTNREIAPLKPPPGPVQKYHAEFCAAMDDDFNAPQAIAVLFDAAREVNAGLASGKPDRALLNAWSELFRWAAGDVLGLLPAPGAAAQDGRDSTDELVKLLLDIRADVRNAKLFPLSDKIRDGLSKAGIVNEDKKEGTSWRRG